MKKTIKRIGLSIATISILGTSSYAVSILGTSVDEATFEMQVTQNVQLLAQVEALGKQVTQQINTFKSQTGIRVAQNFVNKFKELRNFLAENNLDIFDLDLNNPKSQIGQYAKQLFESQTLFDDCSYDYMNDDQKRICKDRMVRGVQELATFSVYKDEIVQSIERVKALTDKLGASEDIKGTADINAQINAQMAQLQVKKTQMDMMLANNKAREKVDRLQKEQLWKKTRNNIQKIEIR